ncbi:helix-turn-helix domain-containing protein [Roseobacter sp.]|uniref:helix-turn-helix domain-containing protein n=1 Tax=Roseobacter sp. TaxID=1907202 RepID=UPI0025EE7720|nr:helix-turn-helix domain-containing protein [Roseobacter sp.]
MYVTIPTEHFETLPPVGMPVRRPGTPEATRNAGSYLFFEGDEVEWLYQVVSGVLRLTRLLEDGRRQVIAFGYPGDIVGFPSGGLHHTDCDVLVDARLRVFRRSALESCVGNPELHRQLLQAALGEISAMQDHFMMLGRKSAAEKLASFLHVLFERVGEETDGKRQIMLPMSRSDIADFLGLTTETVSRTLTQMRKSGIIDIEDIYRVVVLRPDALLRLSLGNR